MISESRTPSSRRSFFVKYDAVINLKSATALGLAVPSLLIIPKLRATAPLH